MRKTRLFALVRVLGLAVIVAGASAVASVRAQQVAAQPFASAMSSSAKGDDLWIQVNTCIQKAIRNGFMPNPSPIPPPTPCVYIEPEGPYANLGNGFAILKPPKSSPYHFLTSPTKAITGIEDPQVTFSLTPAMVNTSYSRNYWIDAWTWLGKTVNVLYKANHKGVVLRPDQMGLAINSEKGRTQNQLHIHMACIKKEVQTTLASVKPPITTTWSAPIPFTFLKNNHSYRAIVLANLSANPFLVVKTVPGYNPNEPGRSTLAVTGKPATAQYYLLEDYTHGSDKGVAEELLDKSCTTQ